MDEKHLGLDREITVTEKDRGGGLAIRIVLRKMFYPLLMVMTFGEMTNCLFSRVRRFVAFFPFTPCRKNIQF